MFFECQDDRENDKRVSGTLTTQLGFLIVGTYPDSAQTAKYYIINKHST